MKLIILLLFNLFTFYAFSIAHSHPIEGKGPIVEQELSLNSFTKLSSEGPFTIIVTQSNTQSILAKGHQNIIDHIKTDIKNNELKIGFKSGHYKNYQLTIYISVPKLSEIKLKGSGNIEVHKLSGNDLTFKIHGAGNIKVKEMITQNLSLTITGSGNIDISGTSTHQDIKITGVGKIHAYGVNNNKATKIIITGSGTCEIKASEKLTTMISGKGNVYYKGTPTISNKITGLGKVNNKN